MDTLDRKCLMLKLGFHFDSLKCAVQQNVAFEFVLKNEEHGSFLYFYPDEDNTLSGRSLLVAARKEVGSIKTLIGDAIFTEPCTIKRGNTMQKIYKLTDVSFLAAFPK